MLYCAQCPGSSFTTREDLATHYKTSSQWHPYCWKCDVDFDDAERFDKHLLANHNPYTCFYCSLRFGSEGAMEQHVLAKHARFRCEVCDSGFETEIGRNRHYRDSSAHPTCSKCGCGCEDCESLRKHERDTHSQLACPPPSGQSVYVDGLDGHYLESPNYLTCSYCLVAFEDRFSCEEHIDSVHSGLQTCSLADRGVVTPEYLYMGSSDYRGDGSNDMECDRGSGDVGEDVVRSNVHRDGVNFFKLSDSIDHLFAICCQVLNSRIDRRKCSGVILTVKAARTSNCNLNTSQLQRKTTANNTWNSVNTVCTRIARHGPPCFLYQIVQKW
ncbi:hypothetical protein PILCRDRAFT_340508 [Piloderma croceum F 1598]|uniref:C2H2-type domain-containing protein n=1 Tax=Piloderma croceum (strain F 1598) TaxID=765440 RepID=A0A0C3G4W4_PILCF|nr:hypothetical protein PILCRDRAFT_340508 [Piloderma croceum F 1598]